MADRKRHHGCIRRSRKGSKYNVQWLYLVGGEVLSRGWRRHSNYRFSDSITRLVGFSPTFPKRGSNFESQLYYINYIYIAFGRPNFHLHGVCIVSIFFWPAIHPADARKSITPPHAIHFSATKTGCGRKSKLWPSSSIVRSWPPFFVEWGIKKNISYRNIFQWWIGYIFFCWSKICFFWSGNRGSKCSSSPLEGIKKSYSRQK